MFKLFNILFLFCCVITATAHADMWQPPAGLKQIALWPNGAPNMDGISQPAESMQIDPHSVADLPTTIIRDVSTPTLTIFPPQGANTEAAMIVFPGGGFKILAIDLEGTEACDWMTTKGITCILVKYRVPKTNDYWEKDCNCQVTPKIPLALQDAQRSIRLVRSKAKDLNIDPKKIGVIGFSAGGYLVAQTSNIFEPAYKPVDAIDKISSRPNFAIPAYPGHLCRDDGKSFDPTIHVTNNTPPTFIIQDWDDQTDPVCNSLMYAHELNAAGVPSEVHLFAKGDHAFGFRHIGHPVETWPALAESWLKEIGMLPNS